MSTQSFDPIDGPDTLEPTEPTREGIDTPQEILDAAHADAAEHRLRSALREIKGRTENAVEDVRALAFPARVVGGALIAGLGALVVVSFVRRARRRRPRSIASAVGRSLLGEIAVRMALGAAGVLGARLASDLLLPAMLPVAVAVPAPRPRPRRSKRVVLDD
jgi:hypothetical protein